MAKPQLAARCDSPADAARRMRGYKGRFVVESKFDGERMMVRHVARRACTQIGFWNFMVESKFDSERMMVRFGCHICTSCSQDFAQVLLLP